MIKKIKLFCLAFFVVLPLSACSSSENPKEKKPYCGFQLEHTELPEGIFIEDKIYWLTNTTYDIQLSGEAHKIKDSDFTEEDCFPSVDGKLTNSASKLSLSSYNYKDDFALMESENGIVQFNYYNRSELGEQVEQFEPDEDGRIYSAAPHFVYKGMRYYTYDGLTGPVPDYFKKVGTIKETYAVANKNFTGNIEVGSELYATPFQNRFMIVKRNDSYSVYENGEYSLIRE